MEGTSVRIVGNKEKLEQFNTHCAESCIRKFSYVVKWSVHTMLADTRRSFSKYSAKF
jgi:hypothetical protein